MGVGFCFFLLIAIWCSTGNLKDREPLPQSLSDFKLHFCQEKKKGGSAVRERGKKKKSVRDDTLLCLSVCFEKASQQNYGSKRLTAAIKKIKTKWLIVVVVVAFSTKGSCSASRSAQTCQAGSSAGRNPCMNLRLTSSSTSTTTRPTPNRVATRRRRQQHNNTSLLLFSQVRFTAPMQMQRPPVAAGCSG